VTPYALVGGGALGIGSSKKALGTDFDRALHWGVGFKTEVVDRVSIRLEGRHLVSAEVGPEEGNTHHFEVLVGVGIALWRHEPEETPVFVEAPPPPREEIAYVPPPLEVDPIASEPIVPLDCTKAANNPECLPEQVIVAEIERAHFAWGSAQLRSGDHVALDNAVELLLEHPHLRLEIQGHTDNTGSERFNMGLSRRRAQAVLDYLVSKGVGRERLTTIAFGPNNPLESNRTLRGRAINRRSEIRVLGD
jgi:outer membrane protein OmpA-like peptidoglycan-associated protein